MPTAIPELYRRFVGIDIAAATVTASRAHAGEPPERPRSFANSQEGFAALQRWLRADGGTPATTLVVMEATGS